MLDKFANVIRQNRLGAPMGALPGPDGGFRGEEARMMDQNLSRIPTFERMGVVMLRCP